MPVGNVCRAQLGITLCKGLWNPKLAKMAMASSQTDRCDGSVRKFCCMDRHTRLEPPPGLLAICFLHTCRLFGHALMLLLACRHSWSRILLLEAANDFFAYQPVLKALTS